MLSPWNTNTSTPSFETEIIAERWKGLKNQSQNIIASKQCLWTEQSSYTYELTTAVMGCAIIVQAQERPDLSMERGAGHEVSCLLLVTVGC